MRNVARTVAAFATLVLASIAANAAELKMPVKAPPAAPTPPPFTWTGFYIGGNLGGAWANHEFRDSLFGLDFRNNNNNGVFVGGGQVGVNYQVSWFVIGVEGTFDWAANNNNNSIAFIVPASVPTLAGNLVQVTANDRWIATAAARLGWAAWDHGLLYVKGGGGWVGANSVTATNLTTGASIMVDNNTTRGGFLVGGGIEWGFAEYWSVKAEYDFLGLSSRTFTVPVGSPFFAGDTFTATTDNNNVQMVTVGINYRFNWWGYQTPAPVQTRY
jgi:outer membrane immunogenic protein